MGRFLSPAWRVRLDGNYIQGVFYIQTVRMSTRKAAQSEATRAELTAVARRLFAERGYANTATEDLVREAA